MYLAKWRRKAQSWIDARQPPDHNTCSKRKSPSSSDMLLLNVLPPLEITGFYSLQVTRGTQERVGTVKLTKAQIIWKILL